MANDDLRETALELQQEWGIVAPTVLTEEELLQLLAARIADLTAKGPEQFYQLMYRLDIPEKKLQAEVGGADPAMGIAQLIYARQVQKIESRRKHREYLANSEEDKEMKL